MAYLMVNNLFRTKVYSYYQQVGNVFSTKFNTADNYYGLIVAWRLTWIM